MDTQLDAYSIKIWPQQSLLLFLQGVQLKSATLQISTTPGKTVWLTILLLILLTAVAEWVARSESFQMPLTPPRMGSRHSQLGHKLALLNVLARKTGQIDCIMLGSSMVDTGFNPLAFETGYRKMTGRDIHCFNFGIDASTAASTAALVRIIVEDYQPSLLILGTDPRDYAVAIEDPDPAVVLNTPWVAYRQGEFSWDGWLLDHSYLYRYRQHLGRLARFQFEGTLWSDTKVGNEILSNGFIPLSKVSTYINDAPNPNDDSFEVTYYTRIYSSYQMLDENLEGLESSLDYNESVTQVILLEMPVADGLYYFFGNHESDYKRFLTQVGEMANLHQVPFWQTEPLDFIPDNAWADYSHLNKMGAEIFSIWLGQQVGAAEHQGSIQTFQP
ncbi:MAG: hypothetical protein M3R47_17050 [Chloroflexota bacterium]|nr:hypothetical protein [Chloroflexota bacterium]